MFPIAPRRFSAGIGWSVRRLVAMLLSSIGIYGLLAYMVWAEGLVRIGIRVGLGSPAGPDISQTHFSAKGYCWPVLELRSD